MLQYLKIRNLALMDEVALEFEEGFTAVTGETGAGKSVLLGALSFLSGARVDKSIIRQGAEACEAEAGLFFEDSARVDAVLEALDLPLCEEGSLILRRVFPRKKMPKVQINGALTTLANLQSLGESWIDFHGPGEPQKLFRERWQRALLDLYAKSGSMLDEYGKNFVEWKKILREIESLREQDQLSEDEVEFIQGQIGHIDRAELSEESVEVLERDFNRLSQSQELSNLAAQLEGGLAGDEGISSKLGPLVGMARDLAGMDEEAATLTERLESLVIELEDVAGEFGSLAQECEFDEEAAKDLQERMELWLELKRKYGPAVASILAKREALAQKIAAQSDIEGTVERLEQEAEKLRAKLEELGGRLKQKRGKAAQELAAKAGQLINALGFKKARLRIEVVNEPELKEHGNTTCRFLFASNAGQELLPLNKIASNGEIARVMLALKAILAQVDATPVLVFDEVDANVGGEIARVVGDELAGLGTRHQVFCITHLPQVAAKAANHYVVAKDEKGKEVKVTIEPVHGQMDKRLVELARMLGDRESASARRHAGELLTPAGRQGCQ